MPDAVDYGVHWIETKPGDANPKTGIPPSLYTLRATNFLIGPGKVTCHGQFKMGWPNELNIRLVFWYVMRFEHTIIKID